MTSPDPEPASLPIQPSDLSSVADLGGLLAAALAPRTVRLDADPRHEAAIRLFNGFAEGCPRLVVDLYGATLVLHNHADPAPDGEAAVAEALAFYREALPWLTAAVVKARHAEGQEERHGRLLLGDRPAPWVREDGVRYALDILGGHDCGLYLDTRGLRAWARSNLRGRTVLNCFAYTGSLGVAALAGGAERVLQLDRSRAALNVAKTSYTLGGLTIQRDAFFERRLLGPDGQVAASWDHLRLRDHRPALLRRRGAQPGGSGGWRVGAHQQGAPTGGRRRSSGGRQQRGLRERRGLHGRAGAGLRRRLPAPGAAHRRGRGFHRLSGDPRGRRHHGPGALQPQHEDRGVGGAAQGCA
ncbi:MAG: class I SAM-dependent methyltransferase [Ardenticatenia bacterium]|nr:class I SAM-dependent methyltransferase [Ardenticatenia bacterium]